MRNLILSIGGVSVGATTSSVVLREEGGLAMWRLAIKPRKALPCAHVGRTAVPCFIRIRAALYHPGRWSAVGWGRVYAQGDLLRFITLNALLAWRAAQIGTPLRCSRYSPGVMPVHVLKLRWKERASVKPR